MSAVPAPETGPDAGAIWHYGDPLGEQRAAETGAVLVDRSHRGVLTLTGDDRQTWLHSISTQYISELPDGASTQNLSLDGQGRVEDHWIQTELGGVTYLDTEPWRGEPLLDYLRKMVFWSKVTPDPADLAVLSLLGPQLSERAVLDALGLDAMPDAMTATPLTRRLRAPDVRGAPGPDRVGRARRPRRIRRAAAAVDQAGVRPAGVWALRGPPGGGGAPTARRRHRRADHPARSGLDRRSRG